MKNPIKFILIFLILLAAVVQNFQAQDDPQFERLQKNVALLEEINRLLVTFSKTSLEIPPGAITNLRKQAALLKQLPAGTVVEIGVHTFQDLDPFLYNNREMDLELTQRQSEQIRQQLIKFGVGAGNLIAKGYGIEKPIASNSTDEGREKNQRVEYLIARMPPETVAETQKRVEYEAAIKRKQADEANAKRAAELAVTRREIENSQNHRHILELYNKYAQEFRSLDNSFIQKVGVYSSLRQAKPLNKPSLCKLLAEIKPDYFYLLHVQNKLLMVTDSGKFENVPDGNLKADIRSRIGKRRKTLLTLENAIKVDSIDYSCNLN